MKIVITGALGHIGSRLIREMPVYFSDVEIVMLDNLSTQRHCSLFNLPHGRYQFVEADILTANLQKFFLNSDAVVHLAAITNAEESFKNKAKVGEVNFVGTEKVARSCIEVNCPLIFPSTTSVYGSQQKTVDEDCPIKELKPQSPYAESKLKAEQLLKNLRESKGLKFLICRFGTVFGPSPGMRFHTAINKFCWQAVTGQPLTVWQTALHQNRPYLSLEDAVSAVKFIIQKNLYNGETYNVITTNTTVKKILDVILLHKPDLSIQYVNTKSMNQLSYEVSNARFKKLGFEFHGKLERGIEETIQLIRGCSQWQAIGQRQK